MICLFCGREMKLVKSHIIPRSMYKPLVADDKYVFILSNKEGVRRSISRTGIYDKGILCFDCERKFDECDNYAALFFEQEKFDKEEIVDKGREVCFKINEFDYYLLKRFLLGLLWRAAVSSQEMFKRVDIGPHLDIIQRMIEEDSVGTQDEYSFVLAKFDNEELGKAIMDPFPERFFNVKCYRFYFAGYVIYIKVDKVPFKGFMRDVMVRPDAPIYVVRRIFERSKEFTLMKELVKYSI